MKHWFIRLHFLVCQSHIPYCIEVNRQKMPVWYSSVIPNLPVSRGPVELLVDVNNVVKTT